MCHHINTMTNRSSFKLLAIVGGFSFALPTLHAEIVPGSQLNVTLALTVSKTLEKEPKASGLNTIYSGSILKTAFDNRAFIAGMKDDGYLPDKTVTGWKLVVVNSDPEHKKDGNGETHSFYLVKTGATPVPVPSSVLCFFSENLTGGVENYSETVNKNDEVIAGKTTECRWQLGLKGSFPVNLTEFSMVGVMVASDKTGPVTISKTPYQFLYQVVRAKLGGIVGSADNNEDPDGDDSLIEGTVSFSAETPIDISGYPAPK